MNRSQTPPAAAGLKELTAANARLTAVVQHLEQTLAVTRQSDTRRNLVHQFVAGMFAVGGVALAVLAVAIAVMWHRL